jgi:hypothetical protein
MYISTSHVAKPSRNGYCCWPIEYSCFGSWPRFDFLFPLGLLWGRTGVDGRWDGYELKKKKTHANTLTRGKRVIKENFVCRWMTNDVESVSGFSIKHVLTLFCIISLWIWSGVREDEATGGYATQFGDLI